jgi:signal transduction histidine kinase
VRLLLGDALMLVALTGVPLGAVTLWGYERGADEVARTQAQSTVQRMVEKLEGRLLLHRRAAQELARMCALQGAAGCRGKDVEHALLALAPLEQSFRSLGVAHGDGLAIDVAPLDGASVLVVEACGGPSDDTCLAEHWARDGRFVEQRPRMPSGRPDVRLRPWYGATLAGHVEWGEPYLVVADGPRINRYRLTYATRVASEAGLDATVAEVSLSLDDLLADVVSLQPTPAALTFIVDGQSRPVLLPPRPEFHGIEATPTGRAISRDFLPLAWEVRKAAGLGTEIHIDGAAFYAESARLTSEPGIEWTITMALPAHDLLGGARRVGLVMAAFGLLAVAIAIWRAMALARRFGRPLHDLEKVSEALVRGEPVSPPATEVLEVTALGERFLKASEAIRQQARLETELRHAQRIATIGTLAGGLVHDLNNQLGATRALLGMLVDERPSDEDLQIALESVGASLELTRCLLAFSRRSSGIQRSVLEVNGMVERVVRFTASTLRSARVDVVTDLPESTPVVLGDPVLLEQVLLNLLLNARDAMPRGGRVTVSVRPRGERRVAIEVADVGTGMSPEVRDKVFDAFFTTKGPGKGTGLGLSIAHGIVAAHRGDIELQSEPGQGSTFTVVLPLASEGAHSDTVGAAAV